MDLFYSENLSEPYIELSSEESRHCLKVLRKVSGEEIYITDGRGALCRCRILSVDKNKCTIEVIEKKEIVRRNYDLHIAISPVKNIERIEWFIEKAVEIGIDTISFIDCKRTERKNINIERLQKIAISAMKQSLQYYLPIINPLQSFDKFIIDGGLSQRQTTKLICASRTTYSAIKNHLNNAGSFLVLIGPEGDFTEDEITRAELKGFKGVLLGDQRLRTETAGIYVGMAMNVLF